jgi:threonine dehydrogenase-like Zn-dependent dehydrogenase
MVLEAVGSPDTVNQVISLVRKTDTIVMMGSSHDNISVNFNDYRA